MMGRFNVVRQLPGGALDFVVDLVEGGADIRIVQKALEACWCRFADDY